MIFACPRHTELLVADDGAEPALRCPRDGERFPVIDGIPILLPDEVERQRIVRAIAGDNTEGASALDFYNRAADDAGYFHASTSARRQEVEGWLAQAPAGGPVLEIGSGQGHLQGIGGADYVAGDYALAALRRYINPVHARACLTAEHLPFADASVRFVVSIDAMEHVPDAARAFAEVARVLKPGGVAYLHPAWHCEQYNCEGVEVRPYRDLTLRQKFIKSTLPIRKRPAMKAAVALPGRVARRLAWVTSGGGATSLHFRKLRPDYEHFWNSDADACSRLDAHEGALFFYSRGYRFLAPAGAGALRQLLARHEALVVQKPGGPTP